MTILFTDLRSTDLIPFMIMFIIITLLFILIAALGWQQRSAGKYLSTLIASELTKQHKTFLETVADNQLKTQESLHTLKESLQSNFSQHRENFDKHQLQNFKLLQDSLQKGINESREQLNIALSTHTKTLNERVEQLTKTTDDRLKSISGQVEKRLSEGFEKTTATFADIVKRLALIDEAQKKITELSGNVVGLQELLSDRKSRGAFGEVQLSALIRNVLPEKHFSFQHTLSNNKRPDCLLFLPEPTGNIAIDAKFPLENYQRLMTSNLSDADKRTLEQQFRVDIRHHINEIASKYIIPNETADGAIMFIPAEAIFAEIHAHYPDLIDLSHKNKVWLVSPTTMMAILTTARAVLKDDATKKQVHLIQEHLHHLSKDFQRFQKRMDNLQRHIEQANDDVRDVNVSAKKITSRFNRIDQLDMSEENVSLLEEDIS